MLKDDWGKHLIEEDFSSTLYVSVKDVGTTTFKNCCFHEQENYLFIWTKNESFLLNRKNLGDVVIVSDPTQPLLSKSKGVI